MRRFDCATRALALLLALCASAAAYLSFAMTVTVCRARGGRIEALPVVMALAAGVAVGAGVPHLLGGAAALAFLSSEARAPTTRPQHHYSWQRVDPAVPSPATCRVDWKGVGYSDAIHYDQNPQHIARLVAAPPTCGPAGAVQWFVRCPACSDAGMPACDWGSAWTERCGAPRAYIAPHADGAPSAGLPLAACLRDHFVVVIGDCTVRSLMAAALDALDGTSRPPTDFALQHVTHGHHLLLRRDTPYGAAHFRTAYRYYREPRDWSLYRGVLPTLADELNALLDAWRPLADWWSVGVTLLFGTTSLNAADVDEMHAWLTGGCNASRAGCPWITGVAGFGGAAPTPRVLFKGHTPYSFEPWAQQAGEQEELKRHVLELGHGWVDAWNTTVPVGYLGADALHYDASDAGRPGGYRVGGPVTTAITNRFLEAMCGPPPQP